MIPTVRMLTGDSIQASVNDILTPAPDGFTTVFQLTHFPIGASLPTLYGVSIEEGISSVIPSASWSVLDGENGIIKLAYSPDSTISYLVADYYTWSFFSDATIGAALSIAGSDVLYAALGIVNSILADPNGTFFKYYQAGDDMVNDAQFSIPRMQSMRDELLRQIRLPENAGEGFVGRLGDVTMFKKSDNVTQYIYDYLARGSLSDDQFARW